MILFYIDESGTGLKDTRTPYFVLSAVACVAEDCPRLDVAVSSLKRKIFNWAEPEDWEI